MTSKAIVLEKKVVRLIQRMPHESDPETLREISGRSIARTIYEQRKNLSDELENVPLDIREIVALYYKELQDEQTMTFKSLI